MPGNELCKFADDTYLIIPATNVESQSTDIDYVETWALGNYLTLKRKKLTEIVFVGTISKRQVAASPPMVLLTSRPSRSSASPSPMVCRRPTISVESSLTARRFSMSWEFCALTAWVIQLCWSSSGWLSLPSYSACSAWWVFTNATDRQAAGQCLLSAQYSLRLLSAWFASVQRDVPGCRLTAFLPTS